MTKTQSLIIAIILGGLSFFLVPIVAEMDPILFGVLKGSICLAVFGIMYFFLLRFGYLALALALALIIIFAPAPYALPIDGIAKFLVALAIIAAVLGIEKRLSPPKEEEENE